MACSYNSLTELYDSYDAFKVTRFSVRICVYKEGRQKVYREITEFSFMM